MKILLVSTYELGHQPLHVASPAARLEAIGHEVICHDLSVQPWDPSVLEDLDALAISVPMHTAMRLALDVAAAARRQRPDLPVCLYGLYAGTSHETVLGSVADRVISGEYEPALLEWIDTLAAGGPGSDATTPRSLPESEPIVHLRRGRFELPARHLLPPLDRYARLAVDGEEHLVGYVEASHGCSFACKHCPVPTVYGGRIRIVGADTVLADIDQLVAAGARHITFGDPDFLNGVHHSRRVIRELHHRHPDLTFDCTTKIELILRHRDVWAEFAEAGCLFVVSAVETVDDEILELLDKGHTTADVVEAIGVLREHGIEMRPSLLPFTPWTTVGGLVDLIEFVAEHDLVGNVDPVHYSIRLLIPEGSLVLDVPEAEPFLGPYRPDLLSYEWASADPAVDELQKRITRVVEAAAAENRSITDTYSEVRALVHEAAGRPVSAEHGIDPVGAQNRPRLTEAWFCCAEPTEMQFEPLPTR